MKYDIARAASEYEESNKSKYLRSAERDMSHLPEVTENFKEGAMAHLRDAKEAYTNNQYHEAYREALWCCENALKAVLVKASMFDPNPPHRGGDRHHDTWNLFQKIKNKKILPKDVISKIDPSVYNLNTIDLSTDNKHADSVSGPTFIGDLRYFDLKPFVNPFDAKDKVDRVENLMLILQNYI